MSFKNKDIEKLQRMSHLTIEQAVDGVFWEDRTGRFYRVNEAASKITGYSQEELLNMSVRDIAPSINTAEAVERLFKDASCLKSYQFEDVVRRKDGSSVPVSVTMNYIEFDGGGFSCTFIRDISKIKAAMEEIERLKDRLQEENVYLREEIKVEHNFEDIIGKGRLFKQLLGQVEQVAATAANVLILGESGTGKELVARAVHKLSTRSERPLVKINCAALPASLIESELFGHEKGAFTGALSKRIGRFELADNGTIFLDEIGELPLELQSKLLRVLQEGEFERLGNPETISVDVRVIAATNRDLAKQVQEGAFREDLFYRLNVFPITCPSLRERKEDIPLLVMHFIEKYSGKTGKRIETVPQKVMDAFTSYSWPGNVRELENIVERALIITRGSKLEIGPWLDKNSPNQKESELISLEENERRHILKALEKTCWRVSGEKGAAKILNIHSQTLVSRMKKLGIKRPV